ncbi:MAG: BMP family ABC transporter substrate-binding protein, partial [Anaerolineales bacterium]|nr:BMP family ABC transporter substrate-binding protein [Anaerolineales bacterium]
MGRKLLAVLMVLSIVAAACTSPTPEVVREEVIVEKEVPVTVEVEKEVVVEKEVIQTVEVIATATAVPPLAVGQVTDMGGIDDKSFNATAWKGIQDAMDDFGVEGKFLESQQQADYAKNIQQFLSEGLDLIVTVGFLLGVDTAIAAVDNPDSNFAIVDYAYPDCWPGATPGKDCGSDVPLDNVLGLTFATDEAAFLAGYLAAGMTKTGKVGTFGGIPIPPVTIFMKGCEAGIAYYNQQHGTSVELLGWDTAAEDGLFTGNFESTDDGRRFAESLMDEGADIILPVAGPVGLGSAAACLERGTMLIGVDTDWYVSAPEFKETYLTSILKNIDVAVYDAAEAVVNGDFKGGVYLGTLANDGVGISSFHDFDGAVSADLKAEIEAAKAALIAGTITVDGVLAGAAEAPDLTGETITIYHFGDLSGPYAAITGPLIHGAEDAVAAINEAGGIYGATLALKFADTASSIDEAVAAYDRFTGEGENPLVMITYGSGEVEALAQRFAEDKIVNLTAGLSARGFYIDSGYTFGLGPIYPDQIGAVMGFLKDNWDTYKPAGAGDEIKLGHLSWPTAFGQGALTDESRAYLADLGIEIVAEEIYDLSPTADTTAAILNAQVAGANVIWTNTLAFGTSVILNDLNALGLRDQFVVG